MKLSKCMGYGCSLAAVLVFAASPALADDICGFAVPLTCGVNLVFDTFGDTDPA